VSSIYPPARKEYHMEFLTYLFDTLDSVIWGN
jgi:hypothetical protein